MSEPIQEEANDPSMTQAGSAPLTCREMLLLFVLATVQFTHILDFVIIMPLGPIFDREMGLSPSQFGSVVATYSISAALAGLLAARYLDCFDRKTALLVLYAGFTLGTFLCAIAPDFLMLLAARTVAGAFGGVAATVVLAIVGDAFHDSRRGTAMGVVMSAFSVASTVGVPLGLELAEQTSWRNTFFLLAAVSAGVLALASVALPSLRGHLGQRRHSMSETWSVLKNVNHLRAFALTTALIFSSFMLGPFLPAFLRFNVGLEQADIKYMYVAGGLATLVSMPWCGRLADRYGKLKVFRILALATLVPVLAMTNLPTATGLPLVLVVTTLFMVTVSSRMVPAMALIAGSATRAYRGSFMSFNSAVQQLAAGVATSIAGFILQKGERDELHGYALVGVLCCLAGIVSVVLAGQLRKAPDDEPALDAVEESPSEELETAIASASQGP